MILANDVAAAVADLNEVETISANRSARESRAHTRTTRVFLTAQVNCGVRVMSGVLQTIDQIEARITRGIAFAGEHLPDRIDGHAAGDVARERAAHAVRDDQDQSFITEIEMSQVLWRGCAVGAGPGLGG